MICFDFFIFRKPKTQRGKRFLQGREAKIHENTKQTIFVKGGNTSQTVTLLLKELVKF
jgi:ribosome production factor 2